MGLLHEDLGTTQLSNHYSSSNSFIPLTSYGQHWLKNLLENCSNFIVLKKKIHIEVHKIKLTNLSVHLDGFQHTHVTVTQIKILNILTNFFPFICFMYPLCLDPPLCSFLKALFIWLVMFFLKRLFYNFISIVPACMFKSVVAVSFSIIFRVCLIVLRTAFNSLQTEGTRL